MPLAFPHPGSAYAGRLHLPCPLPQLSDPRWLLASPLPLRRPLSVDLEPYYQTENEDESPFICSQPRENGMRSCRSVPTLRGEGGGPPCGLDYEAYNSSSNTTCVNWNQYYTNCSAGERNPFKGAINFDNIGYAWIVIFQVGELGLRHSHVTHVLTDVLMRMHTCALTHTSVPPACQAVTSTRRALLPTLPPRALPTEALTRDTERDPRFSPHL